MYPFSMIYKYISNATVPSIFSLFVLAPNVNDNETYVGCLFELCINVQMQNNNFSEGK